MGLWGRPRTSGHLPSRDGSRNAGAWPRASAQRSGCPFSFRVSAEARVCLQSGASACILRGPCAVILARVDEEGCTSRTVGVVVSPESRASVLFEVADAIIQLPHGHSTRVS